MSYDAETLTSAWAHVRLCADPTWALEPPDDFTQANQRLWTHHCLLAREEATLAVHATQARASPFATESRQRHVRQTNSERTQQTTDTGHRAAGEGSTGFESTNESTKRSVQDVIPNSRLARFYGTFFYDDASEHFYTNTESCEAENATTSESGCESDVSPPEPSECWMSPEVDYWLHKLIEDVSWGDARCRNLHRFESRLGSNPGPKDDDFLDSAVEALSETTSLPPTFTSQVRPPTYPICHCPRPESRKQTCYSCPVGAMTQYTVSTAEEAKLHARLHSDQVKAVWQKHTLLTMTAAMPLRPATPVDTWKIRSQPSRRSARTTPTPPALTRAPLDVRLPEFYPDKTEVNLRPSCTTSEIVPPFRSIPVYQKPPELYQARGRGPPITSYVDRNNLIVLTDGRRGKSLENINLRSRQNSNSTEDTDLQQALSDWMRVSYPSRFLDLQYAGTLINELKVHADRYTQEVTSKKESKPTNSIPKIKVNEVCKPNMLQSNSIIWPIERPYPQTLHYKPVPFPAQNFLIQMPQSTQNLSFPHHLYNHHAAMHHVPMPQMTVLSPLKTLYPTTPATLVSSPYYQTMSYRDWQGNALINKTIPIKSPLVMSHKDDSTLQTKNFLNHTHGHLPISSTFMLPVPSSIADLGNAPEKKRLYSAVLSNVNEGNQHEHGVNKSIDMSQLLRSGVESTYSKICQKSSSPNVSFARPKKKCKDPVNCETRFEELEKEALEQYKPSDESIDSKFRELEQQALDQYSGTSNSNTSCSSAQSEAAKAAESTQSPKKNAT